MQHGFAPSELVKQVLRSSLGTVYCVCLPPKFFLVLPDRPVQPDWNELGTRKLADLD